MKKSSACLIALALLWTSLTRVLFAADARTSTVESAEAIMPTVTSVRLNLDQDMAGVLANPALLGAADPGGALGRVTIDSIQEAHPGVVAVQFARYNDQAMVLPHLGSASKPAATAGGPGLVKAGHILDINNRDEYRILDVTQELADHLMEHLKNGHIADAFSAFKKAYDAAAPGAPLTLVREGKTASGSQTAASLKPTDGFALIPPGKFQMGSQEDEEGRWDDEVPHTVILTHTIEAGKDKITQGEFLDVTGYNPSAFRNEKHSDGDYQEINGEGHNVNHPVEQVTWFQAVEYLNKRSERDGLEPAYIIDRDRKGRITGVRVNGPSIYETKGYAEDKAGYRLPTEAEQQYYRRAETETPFWFGHYSKANLDANAWHEGNSGGRTHAVGLKPANAFGINDAAGNVHEWGNDWWGEHTTETVTDPEGPATGSDRVFGGGSWLDDPRFGDPGYANDDVGFRAVRSRNPLALGRP